VTVEGAGTPIRGGEVRGIDPSLGQKAKFSLNGKKNKNFRRVAGTTTSCGTKKHRSLARTRFISGGKSALWGGLE